MPKKSDNSQVATKGDVIAVKTGLETKIQRLDKKVQRFEETMNIRFRNVDTKLDKIASTLDGFVGGVDNLRIENEVGADQIRDLREKVGDHEVRITKLESPSA